jgi:molecular chaperone GrpE (heat shock protein)
MTTNDTHDVADTDRKLAEFLLAHDLQEAEKKHRAQSKRLLLGFIEVLDLLMELERHCQQMSKAETVAAPTKAVSMVVKQALKVLAEAHVERMDCVGRPLDLSTQEVIEVREAVDTPADTVIEQLLCGYLWQGKLLRQAKVVIANE